MSRTPILLVLLGLAAIAAAIGLNEFAWHEEMTGADTETAATTTAAAGAKDAESEAARAPSFDVIRVNPEGDTVIAGKAPPGSEVQIIDGATIIGKIIADDRGEWVFIPEMPLDAGARTLSLKAVLENGNVITSGEDVVISVPERGNGVNAQKQQNALVLKFPKSANAPTKIVQNPSGPVDREQFPLTIDTLDYDAKGNVIIGGAAPKGATVQIYLDSELITRTTAGDDSQWVARPDKPIPPGLYTLRADQIGDQGKVVARVEYPFSRAEDLKAMAEGTYVLVQPGNSLWRIARNIYGSGFSYTQIFDANKSRIIDPDLIFPGQVFEIPNVN